ncbi:hypothetical protein BV20DRAFT_956436 [Pilatotrama ljubarskyi]|nr:hypothetical protein BV20DRAFT_956436 [Pilatotrama ljubarskyi]
MGILALDYDCLRLVISFLDSRDVLHLCLTCKQLYDLAHHQILVNLHLLSVPQVRGFWKWLRTKDGHRDLALTIKHLGFWANPMLWFGPGDGNMESLRWSLVDVLNASRNIRSLQLNVNMLLAHNVRIGSSIASMKHLVRLELADYDDATLMALRAIEAPLTSLRLSISSYNFSVDPKTPSLLAIFLAISRFRDTLRVLSIQVMQESAPRGVPPSQLAPFPALRVVTLSHNRHVPFDIYSLFPNAEVIKVYNFRTTLQDREGGLRSLKYLAAVPSEIVNHARRFPRTPYLHLLGTSSGRAPRQSHIDAVHSVGPLGLAFELPSSNVGSDFWTGLSAAAPQLKCLLVTLQLPRWSRRTKQPADEDEDAVAFVKVLVRVASSHIDKFQLSCLCVAWNSFTTTRIDDAYRELRESDLDLNKPAHEHLSARARAVHTFPQRVAKASPTLKHVGLWHPRPPRDPLARFRERRREDVFPRWHVDVYDTDAITDDIRWWKVVDEDHAGRRLDDCSKGEAKEAWLSQVDRDWALLQLLEEF